MLSFFQPWSLLWVKNLLTHFIMKPFLTAACVKLSRAFAADPVGTVTTIVTTTVAVAPYILGAGAIVGAGYGIYKLVSKK